MKPFLPFKLPIENIDYNNSDVYGTWARDYIDINKEVDNFNREIGLRIKKYRTAMGLSQEELAGSAGLSTVTISNVENAVNLVTQLPLYMQQKMNDFYREASIYNRALYNIDQLIISFERISRCSF